MRPCSPKAGERIVDYEGQTVEALVILASPNGKSPIMQFEAILGGHVGMMLITVDDRDNYISLIEGKPVVIPPVRREPH